MPVIDLDEDVLTFVRSQALPWTDASPSDTFRRLLQITTTPVCAPRASVGHIDADAPNVERTLPSRPTPVRKGRQQNADLYELRRAGVVREGQTLYLHDFSGKPLAGCEAEIGAVNKLSFNGRRYSMSKLASHLLQEHGYTADSVRGPVHWHTADGESISTLWKQHLKRIGT